MSPGTKFLIHSGLLLAASACFLAETPPFPAFGIALAGISIFGFRRLHIYSLLNLSIIGLFVLFALLVDPSVIFQSHSPRWFIILVLVPWWLWKFITYRSARADKDLSHDASYEGK